MPRARFPGDFTIGDTVDVVYRLGRNTYGGGENLQLTILDLVNTRIVPRRAGMTETLRLAAALAPASRRAGGHCALGAEPSRSPAPRPPLARRTTVRSSAWRTARCGPFGASS